MEVTLFSLLIIFIVALSLLSKTLIVVDQYQRGVVLTLGTYSYTLEPGLKILIPIIQRVIKVDVRISTADIPQQEVITKDNVPVGINAVVYFRVTKAEDAV